MTKKRLLVYGDVEMDILLKTTSIDPNDHDVKVEELALSPGGSSANCAAIAGSLGQPVTFLGSVGNEIWSKPIVKDFHRFKVNTRNLRKAPGKTGTCIALVDANGERKFYSYRGVNESAPPLDFPLSLWKQHHCLHLSGYSFQEPNSRTTALSLLWEAKQHGLLVSLDPSFIFARELDFQSEELLSQLDFIFPNREEAELISGVSDPLKAAYSLMEKGVKTVVVTLGREGCLLLSEGVEQHIRIDPIEKVVDTTGAGDAFCAGFLMGVLNDFSLEQSCKLGCASAAHIVTHVGAHENAPVLTDILGIIRQNHEDVLADLLTKKFL